MLDSFGVDKGAGELLGDAFEGSSVNALETVPNAWMLRGGPHVASDYHDYDREILRFPVRHGKSNQHKAAMWNDDLGVVRRPAMSATTPGF